MAKAKRGGKKPTKKIKKKQAKKSVKKVPVKKAGQKKAAPANILVGLNETDNTTLNTLYITDGSDNDITLEVNAGAEGQTSDMTIKLNSSIVTENLSGDFAETSLGTNESLNGKKLNIVATIADTSRETNFTSLTIHLKGGAAPADFPLSKAVEEEGGSVDYLCIIEFFQP